MSLLRPDLVFELTWIQAIGVWRAFYHSPRHYDYREMPGGCTYRHQDAATPADAIEAAASYAMTHRLKGQT